ncbi:MAG: C40 family peptidase [Bacteroidales bacterium]|nr:C40 family peptidase [Bacteroidales bacterium]
MQAGICAVPLLPLRSEPSERSEMISQILFGELFEVLEEKDSWSRIRNHSDGYTGWCTKKMLQLLPTALVEKLKAMQPVITRDLLSPCVRQGEKEPQLYIPAGSRLYFSGHQAELFPLYRTRQKAVNPEIEYWFIPSDSIVSSISDITQSLVRSAGLFLNAPYLWGGKSVLGVDCSGLVQLVYSMCGFFLPRDAKDQALLGEHILTLSEARPGDLAFFTNAEGKVIHVGMMLEDSRIIHASGDVHIDPVDSTGIYSETLGLYTHQLFFIRRLIDTD